MLKSQRHYYWIGGALWAALMLGGAGFLVATSRWEDAGGLADVLDTKVFAQAAIVTGDPEAQGVLVTGAGEVDVGPSGLTLTDPLSDRERPPFDLELPEGRYQAVIYRPEGDPRVIGMVALRFSDEVPARWAKAGRRNRPLDFEFSPDEIVALGDAEAVAALEGEAVTAALAASTGPVAFATLRSGERDVLLLDPSFETFSADIYAGYDAAGNVALLVKDFGYFATRDALKEREKNK